MTIYIANHLHTYIHTYIIYTYIHIHIYIWYGYGKYILIYSQYTYVCAYVWLAAYVRMFYMFCMYVCMSACTPFYEGLVCVVLVCPPLPLLEISTVKFTHATWPTCPLTAHWLPQFSTASQNLRFLQSLDVTPFGTFCSLYAYTGLSLRLGGTQASLLFVVRVAFVQRICLLFRAKHTSRD